MSWLRDKAWAIAQRLEQTPTRGARGWFGYVILCALIGLLIATSHPGLSFWWSLPISVVVLIACEFIRADVARRMTEVAFDFVSRDFPGGRGTVVMERLKRPTPKTGVCHNPDCQVRKPHAPHYKEDLR